MGSPIDWRPNYSIRAYRITSTPSPYYHRHCAGCSDPAEQTGTDFMTLDPDRTLCQGCADE